jgi:hypothetical protein
MILFFAPHTQFAQLARPAIVNGAAGLLIGPAGKVLGVVGFTIVRGRIAQIDIVADPAKLERLVDVGRG